MDRGTRPRKRLVHRRRKRRRQDVIVPGPRVFVAMATLCVGIMWTVMVLFFSVNMEHASSGDSSPMQGQQPDSFLRQRTSPGDVPLPPFQLWPDDLVHKEFLQSLVQCWGEDCIADTTSNQSTKSTLIILVRPHGHFGQIMEELLQGLIKELNQEISNIELSLQSFWQIPDTPTIQQLQTEHEEIKLIHCITSPLLLEAVDLALAISEHDHNYLMDSWKEIETTTRMLVHWHTSVNSIVDKMPTLLLSLQAALTLPQRTDEWVTTFLVGNQFSTKEPSSSMMKLRDKISQRALDRIDRCTRAVQNLVPSSLYQQHTTALHSLMKEWTTQEGSQKESLLYENIHGATRQVKMLLQHSDEQVCNAYPQFCLHQKVMLP